MKPRFFSTTERGQALIFIALAAIGLFAMAGLAIDGSVKFSDRRHAQNAADTAVLAGALELARGETPSPDTWDIVARDRAATNGYSGDLVRSQVWAYHCDEDPMDSGSPRYGSPAGCGTYDGNGNYIQVVIRSNVNTYFARIIGINQTQNTVHAVAYSKLSYSGPPFDGNALVALVQTGNGFDAHGTPDWTITGGGIFVNSSSSNAATCGGSAGITSPGVTTVGGQSFTCHTVNIGSTTTGAPQLLYAEYSSLFPRQPTCNGTATLSGGQWRPQSGADGSLVAFSGDMDFAPGLYCVTNSPGSFHGAISGTGVTFYVMSSNFTMRFNGGGNLTASAPTSGEYEGILMYLAPQVDGSGNLLNTQAIDLRGNGIGDVVGSIIAPSADVTMFGNSGTAAIRSQVIAYQIDSGGNADITVLYQPNDNWNVYIPAGVGLFQ